MITFQITDTVPIGRGTLTYVENDLSFDTIPRPEGAVSSLMVNDVELMLNRESGGLLFVTGYCPFDSWKQAELSAPPARTAFLLPVLDRALQPGISLRLSYDTESPRWPAFADPQTGWVRMGIGSAVHRRAVRFSPGSLAVLDDRNVLVELWLRPNALPAGFLAIQAQSVRWVRPR